MDKNLTIDALMLPDGIAIDGNAGPRFFEFVSGTTNLLDGLATMKFGENEEFCLQGVHTKEEADEQEITYNHCIDGTPMYGGTC